MHFKCTLNLSYYKNYAVQKKYKDIEKRQKERKREERMERDRDRDVLS